ncbi:molybdopterin molybdenumtransferase MoeA [Aestuariivirga litoralis]|uniref:Molybdopterin molybdenumtransferase n=1 Tax=Aestuariivirga litoralis TaxID=2650924 RepID=A0A2W2ANJ3_9HYPH|nr:gephyrin-like molybdotransferase Glp [Aestuariivirga litoralis]PZF77005.1 molybdopterin molybdenumtransferase MoeA [Aestuariivirga litoralis]
MALIPVEEARARILKGVNPLPAEDVTLEQTLGRVLAKPLKAVRNQPPFNASAMDGYAVIAADVANTPATLKLIGLSAAGHAFKGAVKPGQCVRIFTGAPVPKGADAVVIQENTEASGKAVTVLQPVKPEQNIRFAGLDFRKGDALLPAGLTLGARDIGLAAAANAPTLAVRRRPVVALIATGDELVLPGGKPRADQIVSSNSHALAAMAQHLGARVMNLGIVPDNLKATERAIARAATTDILVTTGGASVGDHDYVQEALKNSGVAIDFWKIAMRPGKPFMYGRRRGQHVLGLPGNPVSSLVCARLFLKPLIDALLGLPAGDDLVEARLGASMKENDSRQDYVRARLVETSDGYRTATPFAVQDSSMQRTFREAEALIVRPPRAPVASAGDVVKILRLDF